MKRQGYGLVAILIVYLVVILPLSLHLSSAHKGRRLKILDPESRADAKRVRHVASARIAVAGDKREVSRGRDIAKPRLIC